MSEDIRWKVVAFTGSPPKMIPEVGVVFLTAADSDAAAKALWRIPLKHCTPDVVRRIDGFLFTACRPGDEDALGSSFTKV